MEVQTSGAQIAVAAIGPVADCRDAGNEIGKAVVRARGLSISGSINVQLGLSDTREVFILMASRRRPQRYLRLRLSKAGFVPSRIVTTLALDCASSIDPA